MKGSEGESSVSESQMKDRRQGQKTAARERASARKKAREKEAGIDETAGRNQQETD